MVDIGQSLDTFFSTQTQACATENIIGDRLPGVMHFLTCLKQLPYTQGTGNLNSSTGWKNMPGSAAPFLHG
jgi:hypothetical protein